jgi:hypothetical protein
MQTAFRCAKDAVAFLTRARAGNGDDARRVRPWGDRIEAPLWRPHRRKENIMSNITPGHVRVFQAVRSQLYDNITLASCTINGEPGVAIVMVDEAGKGKVGVMPLFVAITPSMELAFAGEQESGGGGGGPKDPREAFQANKEATRPSPR